MQVCQVVNEVCLQGRVSNDSDVFEENVCLAAKGVAQEENVKRKGSVRLK